MLVAVLLYSGYSVGLRLKPAMRWQSLMLAMSVAALVTSLPFFLWEVAAGKVIVPDARGWAVIALHRDRRLDRLADLLHPWQ